MKARNPSTGIRFFTWLVFIACVAVLFLWLQQKAVSHANPQEHLVKLEKIRNNPEERLRAIGKTDELPEQLKRAFDPGVDFDELSPPQPGDWLWQYAEPGQTFPAFVKSEPNLPDVTRRVIYLQPLAEFPGSGSPSLDELRAFATAYFSMEVRVQPAIDIAGTTITSRANPSSGQQQLLTGDILILLKEKLPGDAFCMLAVTMIDLYPEPSWNYVFGQATVKDRVGVFSLALYDPRFHNQKLDRDSAITLLRRSCKVLAHETGHMFGNQHCIFFNCLMNGSNHLSESDSQPIHLCPVDLRKLQHSVGFNIAERYQRLERFYKTVGLTDEARWVKRRLPTITGSNASKE